MAKVCFFFNIPLWLHIYIHISIVTVYIYRLEHLFLSCIAIFHEQRIRFLADIAAALVPDIQTITTSTAAQSPGSHIESEAKVQVPPAEQDPRIGVEQAAGSVCAKWVPLITTAPILPEQLCNEPKPKGQCLVC
jgi:hypothetical protein